MGNVTGKSLARKFVESAVGKYASDTGFKNSLYDAADDREQFALECAPIFLPDLAESNVILLADLFAAVADRAGLSRELKPLVPDGARTSDFQKTLGEAPHFLKLCG